MNAKERKQFIEVWLELENIVTVIEPSIPPEQWFKRPEKCGFGELKSLLQFLRLQVKLLLHDRESTERENITLSQVIEKLSNKNTN